MSSITWTGNLLLGLWSLICRSFKWTYLFCSSRYFDFGRCNNTLFLNDLALFHNWTHNWCHEFLQNISSFFLCLCSFDCVSILSVSVRIGFLLIWLVRVPETWEAPAPISIRAWHLNLSISIITTSYVTKKLLVVKSVVVVLSQIEE